MPRLALLLTALAAPATALAQTPVDREGAIAHYERGRTLYAAGRYRQAVTELETALALDPSGTNLLLNLGTVHERLGNLDAALVAYGRHLAATADPEERARTQRIITRLQGARLELAELSPRRGRADGLFWASAGASITLLTLGTTMLLATDRADDRTAPLAFTVAGGGLGVLAAVLYFARESQPRQTLFVTAGLAPGAAALGVAGAF